jgi:hypothetical protein
MEEGPARGRRQRGHGAARSGNWRSWFPPGTMAVGSKGGEVLELAAAHLGPPLVAKGRRPVAPCLTMPARGGECREDVGDPCRRVAFGDRLGLRLKGTRRQPMSRLLGAFRSGRSSHAAAAPELGVADSALLVSFTVPWR